MQHGELMEDRELLELAANAVGIISDGLGGCYDFEREKAWNPLTDDGDALRLASRLQIWIRYPGDGRVSACWYDENGFFAGYVNELSHGDPRAATRRAIVRVAAEIGSRGA